MKKLLLGLVALFLFAGVGKAQEDPEKAIKKASRALSAYNINPNDNEDKLKEAKEMADLAAGAEVNQQNFDAFQTKGEVYNAIASNENTQFQMAQLQGEKYELKNLESALVAQDAFITALKLAEKKYQTKDALRGLEESVPALNQFANAQLANGDYTNAFDNLKAVLDVRQVLMDNGEKDPFQSEEDLLSHKFVTGYCAAAAGKNEAAKELFSELYDKGYKEARVYANYFRILNAENDPKALEVLQKGRELFPENTEILFAEINYYIRTEQYDILEQKLKDAIAREPDNPSVYSALGNVYMNLHKQEHDAGNNDAADAHYEQSLEYYGKALEIDPEMFDAIYSIGSVYFNEAVEIVAEMNQLGLSKEEQKRYNELSKEVDVLFEKALPYFKRAEKINPNDRNTLIALKEIFARQKDYEKSNEFKNRLDNVESGTLNESSFFN